MSFSACLSGEIHTKWRDAAGDHVGETESQFRRDHQSAEVNAVRTRAAGAGDRATRTTVQANDAARPISIPIRRALQ